MRALPDALEDALGRVVAGLQLQWGKELERMAAESRARDAESRSVIAELRKQNHELQAQLVATYDRACARIDEVVATIKDGEPGPVGPPGLPGEPGLAGERGEKGEPGERGEPGEVGERGPEGPAGESGAPGEPGPQGQKGEAGDRGEVGLEGKEGPEGRPGRDGQPGRDGLQGLSGKDGDPGKDGRDGKDGMDGFSLDDLNIESPDDGRTIVLTFARDGIQKRHVIHTAFILYQGVWTEGHYQRGDVVTIGGSAFVATGDTDTRPETEGCDWKLCVKRGQNGKDGKQGDKGEKGDPGKNGRDLTQLGPDGSKW